MVRQTATSPCAPKFRGEAVIAPPASAWNAISINANYVTIEGFEIRDARGDGIEGNGVHHVNIINNTSHGNGESGIQFNWSEFLVVEGNTTYSNAWSTWASGISIFENRNITGDTTTPGYRTIVRDNVSYDNITDPSGGPHTDGNGIIIDDFQNSYGNAYSNIGPITNYDFPTLVENNLVYNNGGKGLQILLSNNVMVRNNTAYHNNLDDYNDGTWRGEISNSQSSNNHFINNIAVSDPTVNINNRSIDNTSHSGYKNTDIVWENNLTFNGTLGQASVRTDGGNASLSATKGNLLGVDPGFVDPANGDFTLKAASPAVDAGTDNSGCRRRTSVVATAPSARSISVPSSSATAATRRHPSTPARSLPTIPTFRPLLARRCRYLRRRCYRTTPTRTATASA